MADSPDGSLHRWWPWVTVFVVGAAFRFTGLGLHSLWYDELLTVYLANAPDFVEQLARVRNPPLPSAVYRVWIAAFGESDAILRLLPALVSTSTVGFVVLWLPRLVPRPLAWLACLLLAICPFSIWYGQEVRGYAFLECGAVLHALGVFWLMDRKRAAGTGVVLVAGGAALAFGAHYTGYLLGAQAVAVAWLLWQRGIGRPKTLVAVSIGGAMLWAPWILTMFKTQATSVWAQPDLPPVVKVLDLPVRLFLIEVQALGAHANWLGWVLAVGVAAGLACGVVFTLRRTDPWARVCLLLAVAPFAMAFLAALLGARMLGPRYLFVAQFGMTLVLAVGISGLPRIARRVALAMVVAGFLTLSLAHKHENLRDDFRAACAEVADHWQPGDHVMALTGTFAGFSEAAIQHYCREQPDLLSALVSEQAIRENRLPPGRLHLVFREAPYSWPLLKQLGSIGREVYAGPMRRRVQYRRYSIDP